MGLVLLCILLDFVYTLIKNWSKHDDSPGYVTLCGIFFPCFICLLHLVVTRKLTNEWLRKRTNLMFRDLRKIYPGMPSVKLISEALRKVKGAVEPS